MFPSCILKCAYYILLVICARDVDLQSYATVRFVRGKQVKRGRMSWIKFSMAMAQAVPPDGGGDSLCPVPSSRRILDPVQTGAGAFLPGALIFSSIIDFEITKH